MPIGNPQDILTTPYGYTGQVAPETAVNLQNLNRRRLIANMLMQQGLQPAQGQMVGRFYVPPSLAQGFAGLGSTLAGALLAGNIDKKSSEAVDADSEMVRKAIADAMASQGQSEPPPQPQPAPTPDQPFTGEVGAVPMPDPGVQSAQPPIPATRPASQAGIEGMQGLDMANAQPADMATMANSANPDMAQAQAATAQTLPQAEPPAPAVQPPPAMPDPTAQQGRPSFDAIARLMTNQHPRAREYGRFLAQMAQQEQERAIAARNRQEDMGLKILQHSTPSGSASIMAEAQQATAREAHADRRDAMNRAHEDQQAILQENRRHYASDEAFKKAKLALDERQEKERIRLERDKLAAKGNDVAEPKITQDQANANLYADRMEVSDAILKSIGTDYSPIGIDAKQRLGNVPLLGGVLEGAANLGLSDKSQQAEQAQRDFINAVLRRESGATINPDEFNNAKKQYFPQAGDSEAVIAQKEANRATAIRGLRTASGPLGKGKAAPQAGGAGPLSPEEQKELETLRKKYGR